MNKSVMIHLIMPNSLTESKHNTLLRTRTYNIGSPPPAASKNDVLKLRSVKTMVIPPAKTGNDR